MSDESKPRSETCACNYLQYAADDPQNPIRFDEVGRMYQFTYQEPDCVGLSVLLIYHCPFCGGAALRSRDHDTPSPQVR